MYKRILLPTDFSASADAALAVALLFAERCDAELHVLHNLAWLDAEVDRGTVEAAAKARLDAALDRHRGKDDQFRVLKRTVVGAATATSILDYVAQEDIQLVVMGTHGRGLLHLLVGSVAEEVVRLAPCPVVAVRAVAEAPARVPRSILVPFDFSEPSRQALIDARALAAFFGAELVLLNVISDYYYTNEFSGAAISIRDLMPDVEQRHLELLQLAFRQGKGPDVPVSFQAVLGSPLETIVACSKERNCDLIVMGTHGRGGLGHLLLGSTTERVLRLAACPVFTVKADPG